MVEPYQFQVLIIATWPSKVGGLVALGLYTLRRWKPGVHERQTAVAFCTSEVNTRH